MVVVRLTCEMVALVHVSNEGVEITPETIRSISELFNFSSSEAETMI